MCYLAASNTGRHKLLAVLDYTTNIASRVVHAVDQVRCRKFRHWQATSDGASAIIFVGDKLAAASAEQFAWPPSVVAGVACRPGPRSKA